MKNILRRINLFANPTPKIVARRNHNKIYITLISLNIIMHNLKELIKTEDGELTLDGKIVEAEKIGEIEFSEPIENLLSSRGHYNPLRFREQQISSHAEAYFIEAIECLMKNPFQVSITDYKVFRIEFYTGVKEFSLITLS